jgi:hypothetical protein
MSPSGAHAEESRDSGSVTVVQVGVHRLSDLLRIPCYEEYASRGGAGLVAPAPRAGHLAQLEGLDSDRVTTVDARGDPLLGCGAAGAVLVLGEGSSPIGAPVAPVIFATSRTTDGTGVLSSDSTHRVGLVVPEDLIATVAELVRAPDPPTGSRIRVVSGQSPAELQARHARLRELYFPLTSVAIAWCIGVTLWAILLVWHSSSSSRAWSIARSVVISPIPLGVALLAVGHLDRFQTAGVAGLVVGLAASGTVLIELVRRRRGELEAVFWLGVGLVSLFGIETALSWTAALTPFLGGAQLDGGRYFGMPNIAIGLVLGGCAYVARGLRSPTAGGALFVAAGVLAGFPTLGANLGAGVTLFATAGLWMGLRRRWSWWATALLTAGLGVAGAGVIVMAHRISDVPTHVSRALQESPTWLERYLDRLQVGIDLVGRYPLALGPIIGAIILIPILLRPTASLQPSLAEYPGWRDALLTISVGSLIAYLTNDTGAAALGTGFATAIIGLLYVSMGMNQAMMGAR